ncbi:hypothetical protein [uncultured Ferrovibrio sp.]|jgi:hypothetical protein|uniref:hypothetical protein n=1 Tax=uncultured Ferrovibrio sp. TaxID=1576913 RepID=UPI00260E8BCE|nr:hypothetical protein [uncultured Ferrovibrio sp.]
MSDNTASAMAEARGPQPTRKLPTTRAGFSKQMDALRAYALLSSNGSLPVRYPKVGETIKMHESNVSSMNPFFLDNGFIEKQGNGYIPHPAVLEFNRAYSWNPETAAQKLAPLLRETWFAQVLMHRLSFRAMPEDEAIEHLASACNAGPDAKLSLRLIIDYMEAGGLIRRENGALVAIHAAPTGPAEPERPQVLQAPAQPAQSPPPASMADAMKAGAINFQISVSVDMAQISTWPADRIASFFSGIAQVIAAQQKKDG